MSYPSYRNYVTRPMITVPGDEPAHRGAMLWHELDHVAREHATEPILVVDCYPGVDVAELSKMIEQQIPAYQIIDVEEEAARPSAEIELKIEANLTDDRVFGIRGHQTVEDFYDPNRLRVLEERVQGRDQPLVVIGWGAALIASDEAVVVLADMPRREIQRRFRQGSSNWHCNNGEYDNLRKVKRGYFVEWPTADRHKKNRLFDRMDYLLDTTSFADDAVLITADTFRAGLERVAHAPFRLVPIFDPGVWGGRWMQEVFDLPPSEVNYAWCFDGVPEEESLLLATGSEIVEIPALDLVLQHPRELLGERTFARFGAEFPIRFDFLDTMDGGNLSLQVHPLTDYIQEKFGMSYTQDESYYLMDAGNDAQVYLGVKDSAEPEEMMAALRRAESKTDCTFPAEQYVNTFPVSKHDHVSIPAGTVHCSGRNSMVLEISATPNLFTFKMWDWGRLGLDGRPRPVHLDHAEKNIQWDRRADWVSHELINRIEQLSSGPDWVEERTGLHEFEFVEVRRTWFSGTVECDTCGTVQVLNLVEGAEAIIESPINAFEPYVVHYAETFIVPAAVGSYTVRPHGSGIGQRLATIRAYVRDTNR